MSGSASAPLLLALFFNLRIACVITPIGQNARHERGLKRTIIRSPGTKEVGIMPIMWPMRFEDMSMQTLIILT